MPKFRHPTPGRSDPVRNVRTELSPLTVVSREHVWFLPHLLSLHSVFAHKLRRMFNKSIQLFIIIRESEKAPAPAVPCIQDQLLRHNPFSPSSFFGIPLRFLTIRCPIYPARRPSRASPPPLCCAVLAQAISRSKDSNALLSPHQSSVSLCLLSKPRSLWHARTSACSAVLPLITGASPTEALRSCSPYTNTISGKGYGSVGSSWEHLPLACSESRHPPASCTRFRPWFGQTPALASPHPPDLLLT